MRHTLLTFVTGITLSVPATVHAQVVALQTRPSRFSYAPAVPNVRPRRAADAICR